MANVLRSWGSFVTRRRGSSTTPTPPPSGQSSPCVAGGLVNGGVSMDCDENQLTRTVSSEQKSRLEAYLSSEEVDRGEDNDSGLRKLCWQGIPSRHRALCWKLLSGHVPSLQERRGPYLAKKRKEYNEYRTTLADAVASTTTAEFKAQQKVIFKDVPRTGPELPFFQHPLIQGALTRILSIWTLRHPTPGYVQGMNDLLIPFFYVFLSEHIEKGHILGRTARASDEGIRVLESEAGEELLGQVEADAYWCVNRLLDYVQDNYTDHQPGIQQKMRKLTSLVEHVSPALHEHLEECDVVPMHYAFRYFNCLFVREFPLPMVARLWDTFLAEGDGFPDLQVYGQSGGAVGGGGVEGSCRRKKGGGMGVKTIEYMYM